MKPICTADAPATVFLAADKPLRLDAEAWQAGMPEWPSITIPVPKTLRDFRGYDRLVVDLVNETDAPGPRMYCYISGPTGHVSKGLSGGSCTVPAYGFKRCIIPLKGWEYAEGVDPADIARVHFFFTRPKTLRLAFYRLTLLPKGVACPPPTERFMTEVVKPLEAKGAELKALAEKRRAEIRKAAADVFRGKCQMAGQKGAFCIGSASPMEKIRPRDGAFPAVASSVSLRLARGEKESMQLFVLPRTGDLANVRVSVSKLACGDVGFPSDRVSVAVLGYVNVTNPAPYLCGVNEASANPPGYVRKTAGCETGWWPDPILGFLDRTDVRGDDLQGFWLRVHAPEDQPAGVYRGRVTVSADGVEPVSLPISVRVNRFTVPRTPMLPLAVTFSPDATDQHEDAEGLALAAARRADPLSPINQWKKHKAEWCDFLADHYLSYDSLYHSRMPDFEMLERQWRSGMKGKFNLGYWGVPEKGEAGKEKWRKGTLGRLKAGYEKAKALGMLGGAYAYGCDEASADKFERINWAAAEIRRELPGVPISTTAYDGEYGVGSPLGTIDWFTPQTVVYDRAKADKSRAAGHQVWWYFACDQKAPCANSFIECQGIELRSLMGAQSVRFRPDGYLYYEITLWNSIRPISSGPFTDWDPRSWTTYHGDGSWTCCGPDGTPLSTVRLENFSDGLEDFAYAMLLERRLAAEPNAPWAAKARELLAVPDSLVQSVTNYCDDPAAIYAWRDAMADLLE